MKFNKTPLNIENQIEILKDKYKINCKDENILSYYLVHCNYYKLSGYKIFFEKLNKEIYFEEIINLYEFDRELKILFLDYIERIETSIKSVFAYHLTTKYKNSHIHLDKKLFINEKFYKIGLDKLEKSYLESKEIFAKHFQTKYEEQTPPLWVSVEFMTLGEISKWYKNLNLVDRKDISKIYNIKERYLWSFLFHLTEIRNISAHNSRLWNRNLSKGFQIPHNLKIYPSKSFKIYHTIMMLDYVLKEIKVTDFLDKILNLINKYNIPLKYMGFSKNIKGLKYEI